MVVMFVFSQQCIIDSFLTFYSQGNLVQVNLKWWLCCFFLTALYFGWQTSLSKLSGPSGTRSKTQSFEKAISDSCTAVILLLLCLPSFLLLYCL